MENNSLCVCRLCVQDSGSEDMISISENIDIEDHLGIEISNVVLFCLDLDLRHDDLATTKRICNDCVERLKYTFAFKKFCQQNNEMYFASNSESQAMNFGIEDNDFRSIFIKEEPINNSIVYNQELLRQEELEKGQKHKINEKKPNANTVAPKKKIQSKIASGLARTRQQRQQQEDPEGYAETLGRKSRINRSVLSNKKFKESEISAVENQATGNSASKTLRPKNDKDLIQKETERRKKAAARMARYRERLKQNPEKYAKALAQSAEHKRLSRRGLGGLSKEEKKQCNLALKLNIPLSELIEDRKLLEKAEARLAMRRKAETENTRRYRERLRLENPEKYAMQIARSSERARLRRQRLNNSNNSSKASESQSASNSEETLTQEQLIKQGTGALTNQLALHCKRNAKNQHNEPTKEELGKHLDVLHEVLTDPLELQNVKTEAVESSSISYRPWPPETLSNEI